MYFGFTNFFSRLHMYFRKKALRSNVVLRIVLILEKDTTAKEKEKNTGNQIWIVPCFNFHKKKNFNIFGQSYTINIHKEAVEVTTIRK